MKKIKIHIDDKESKAEDLGSSKQDSSDLAQETSTSSSSSYSDKSSSASRLNTY